MSESKGSQSKPINRKNVGRIAERIVANELEYRGFRVSDLNKDGTSANADLLAVGHERTWQIQVKGSTNETTDWWFQYRFCTRDIMDDRENNTLLKKHTMFNRIKETGFYRANFVVLVAVNSPKKYCCVVMPVDVAEKAAQMSLDRDYRVLKRNKEEKKPNKVWVLIDSPKKKASRILKSN